MARSQALQRYGSADDLLGITTLFSGGPAPVGGAGVSPFQAFASLGPSRPSPSASNVRQNQAPASPQTIPQLRQQQAEFAGVRRELDRQNSFLAYPALAPVAAVAAAETPAAMLARFATPLLRRVAFDFPELETWQQAPAAKPAPSAPKLDSKQSASLRAKGRERWAQANGMEAAEMEAHVHHSNPLRFSHLFPKADPNRLANLWALRPEAHQIATRAWEIFSRGLSGRTPTQAEIMAEKLRIDRLVEAYLRRPGVPRSRPNVDDKISPR